MRPLLMRRAAAGLSLVTVALSPSACNDDGMTGTSALRSPRAAVVTTTDTATSVSLLTRTKPLLRDVTYSVSINGNGGMINIPEAGLQIRVPSGAVKGEKPVRFTVTAVAGDAVAYKFGPHGMKFTKPLYATQDLSFTTYDGTGSTAMSAGYFASDSDLDVSRRTAKISESFPTDIVATGSRVHWDIPHFSGYIIATGKSTK